MIVSPSLSVNFLWTPICQYKLRQLRIDYPLEISDHIIFNGDLYHRTTICRSRCVIAMDDWMGWAGCVYNIFFRCMISRQDFRGKGMGECVSFCLCSVNTKARNSFNTVEFTNFIIYYKGQKQFVVILN